MDATILIVVAVLVLGALGIGGAVAASRGGLPGGLVLAGGRARRAPVPRPSVAAPAPPSDDAPIVSAAEPIDLPVTPAPRRELNRLRDGPAPRDGRSEDGSLRDILDDLTARLARIEDRLAAAERVRGDEAAGLRRAVGAEAGAAVEVARVALAAEVAALAARQEAALERLRAEVAAGVPADPGGDPDRRMLDRRADTAADLYARVARLESALAQVTNPVLLPGEPYAPPAEFLPEALAWENWKDVGERAFALADGYSAQRLFLSDRARTGVAAFVTTLRGVLTRVVYPNLAVDATAQQVETLRDALATLAAELPAVRRALEDEYRAAAGDSETPRAGDPPPGA